MEQTDGLERDSAEDISKGRSRGGPIKPYTNQQKHYLEAVFAVSAYPEEYVKYRLHLATGLEVRQINNWFHNRRQKIKRNAGQPGGSLPTTELVPDVQTLTLPDRTPLMLPPFSSLPSVLQNSPPQPLSQALARQNPALKAATVQLVPPSVQVPTRPPPSSQPAIMSSGSELASTQWFHSFNTAQVLKSLSDLQTLEPTTHGAVRALAVHTTPAQQPRPDSCSAAQLAAQPSSSFTESDLTVISSLVGLQTITSQYEHAGSRQLYLFEQLTHLDSLSTEGAGAPNPKRRRTRHQHFWRNSDKFPKGDRVYVSTKEIKSALDAAAPVSPKPEIDASERTNQWTVCLTSRGVINYLNKKISPLGVRLFRSLASQLAGLAGPGGDSDHVLAGWTAGMAAAGAGQGHTTAAAAPRPSLRSEMQESSDEPGDGSELGGGSSDNDAAGDGPSSEALKAAGGVSAGGQLTGPPLPQPLASGLPELP